MRTASIRGCSRTRCARSRRGSRITASTRSTSISPTCIRPTSDGELGEPAGDPWWRARRSRAVDQGGGARGDGAFVLDRRRAEQAPREDRLRARQAGRADAAAPRRTWRGASGRCRRARSTASDRSRARSSKRSASARSASSRPPIPRGSSSISVARTARSCTTPRTAATSATSHRDGAEVDQPRDDVRARPLGAARPRRAVGRSSRRCATGVADDLKRKGYVGKTIGLKLRYDNFKTVTRDRTLELADRRRRTRSGARPANA